MRKRILSMLAIIVGLSVSVIPAIFAEPAASPMQPNWEARLTAMEEKISSLELENIKLKDRIGALEGGPVPAAKPITLSMPQEKPSMPKDIEDFLKSEKTLVKVGKGSLNVGGLLQEWFTVDDTAADSFRLRRGEIKLYGQIVPKWNYVIMFDPAKDLKQDATGKIIQDSRSLKDMYMDLSFFPDHVLRVGQFKPPITEEGPRSSALLDTIERAFITNTFGDVRDIGAMVTGSHSLLLYQAAVFNGQGSNTLDVNDKKDFAGRVVLKPLKGLELGGSGYLRTQDASEKKRIAAEFRYAFEKFSLKTEFARGQTDGIPLYGWYAQAGYMITPKWQGVFKFDSFDPNERAGSNKENDITLGINYFVFDNNAKWQLNYVFRDRQDKDSANQVRTALQVAF